MSVGTKSTGRMLFGVFLSTTLLTACGGTGTGDAGTPIGNTPAIGAAGGETTADPDQTPTPPSIDVNPISGSATANPDSQEPTGITPTPNAEPEPTDVTPTPAPEPLGLKFEGGVDYGPMNDAAHAAASLYTGVLDPAVVNANSAPAYVSSLVHRPFGGRQPGKQAGIGWDKILVLPGMDITSTTANPPADGVHDCKNNRGTYTTTSSISSYEGVDYSVVSYEYNECLVSRGDAFVSGSASLASTATSAAPSHQFMGIEGLRIVEYGLETLYVTGAIKHPTEKACNLQTAATAFLHLKHETNEELVLNNLSMAVIGTYQHWCTHDQRGNVFNGDMLLSNHGRVSVATPTHLSHQDQHRIQQAPVDSDGRTFGGLMSVVSEDGSSSEFTYGDINLRPINGHYYQSFSAPTVQFKLFDNGVLNGELEVDHNAFFRASLSDTNDIDVDGMMDGWELAYGLDPNDPTDAAGDKDSDGLSNLTEFERYGSPTDRWSKGRSTDQSVSLSAVERFDAIANQQYLDVTLGGTLATKTHDFPAKTILLTITGDASFEDKLGQPCYVTSPKTARCGVSLQSNITYGSSNGYGGTAPTLINYDHYSMDERTMSIVVSGSSDVAVNAEMQLGQDSLTTTVTPDPDHSNNSASVSYLMP